MAFRGQYDHSLDAKNRLNVPAKFRAAFADGVVMQKWLEPCVAVWTPNQFEAFTESFLAGLNPLSRERRRLSTYFSGNSWDVELDSAGRVLRTYGRGATDSAALKPVGDPLQTARVTTSSIEPSLVRLPRIWARLGPTFPRDRGRSSRASTARKGTARLRSAVCG